MKQVNRDLLEMNKNQLQRLVTVNFLAIVDEIVRKRLYVDITNEKELADFLAINQSVISKLKSDENRYVSLDMLARLVNILGANSNNVFVLDKAQKEKLIRESFVMNAGRSGNTNNISNSKIGQFIQGAIVNGDNNKGNINTTLKIINGLPAKDKKELKEYFASITNQNSGLQNEVGDLKKTLTRHEKAINEKNKELKEKDKQLFEMSQKYISLLENKAGGIKENKI